MHAFLNVLGWIVILLTAVWWCWHYRVVFTPRKGPNLRIHGHFWTIPKVLFWVAFILLVVAFARGWIKLPN